MEGTLKVADPLSELVIVNGADQGIPAANFSNVPTFPIQTTGTATWIRPKKNYQWQVNNFVRPNKGDLIVYELLVRDFSDAKNFQVVIDSF